MPSSAEARAAALAARLPPYRTPTGFASATVQTVWASKVRQVDGVVYRRTVIDLPDGDVLDVDHAEPVRPGGPRRVVIIAHGLEGSSSRTYVRGMARALTRRGWAVAAWNLRGCGGEPNRLVRAYHSGATEDLAAVVAHVVAGGAGGEPDLIALVGFSLGGNLTLKYAADAGSDVDPRIVAVVGISVPVDLAASSTVMEGLTRRPYMRYFLRSLVAKAEQKAAAFPDAPSVDGLRQMRTFREFDGHFTAPLHGFASAEDYWARASALPVLPRLAVPTLLVNALDDPFLAPSCFPPTSGTLHVLTPRHGGHVGFVSRGGEYWSETVAALWIEGLKG